MPPLDSIPPKHTSEYVLTTKQKEGGDARLKINTKVTDSSGHQNRQEWHTDLSEFLKQNAIRRGVVNELSKMLLC